MKKGFLYNFFLDFSDSLKYGVFKKEIPSIDLPKHLEMTGGYDEGNKVYWLECEELPGFVVSASSKKQLLREIYETLLVYFDVPRYFAKRMNDYGELVMPDGRKIKMVDTQINLNYAS